MEVAENGEVLYLRLRMGNIVAVPGHEITKLIANMEVGDAAAPRGVFLVTPVTQRVMPVDQVIET